jgi:hypothetical protein
MMQQLPFCIASSPKGRGNILWPSVGVTTFLGELKIYSGIPSPILEASLDATLFRFDRRIEAQPEVDSA